MENIDQIIDEVGYDKILEKIIQVEKKIISKDAFFDWFVESVINE